MLDNAKKLSLNRFLLYSLRTIPGVEMKRDIQSLKRCLGIALVVLSFVF
jgi:hypothetical protein